ncbi:MAG: hypothetical protein VX563_03280 [Planctomycetota bacterium]|nr:hypothetical protein [Planctomycetota bacterium]
MSRMQDPTIRTRPGGRSRHVGFTLVETALATVIIGTGVLAMVSAHQVLLDKNGWSTMASTAALLGNEIREMTLNLPRHDPVTNRAYWGPEPDEATVLDFDDVDDFDGPGGGLVFSSAMGNGPIDANRSIIGDMDGWERVVRVRNVDPFDILNPMADGTSEMVRVEVEILHRESPGDRPRVMTRLAWITPK